MNDARTGLSEICAAPDGPKKTIQAAISDPGTVDGDAVAVGPGVYNEDIDFMGKSNVVFALIPWSDPENPYKEDQS